jgi:type 1 glutamine amidotransferase
MTARTFLACCVLALSMPIGVACAAEGIPAHQAKRIEEAAPAKARVAAKKARRVLVWNTPAHLMEKDPHKGYCIPYGSAAFETIGRKTGAYEPVVSGDLAMYLPENIRRFDVIVMNNSSGPWITPTPADMATDAFKKHGSDPAAVEQVLRKSLIDYVNDGGGIVCIHYAIAANRHWPGFGELIGAKFTGHPWNEEIGVTAEEPDHPLLAAFGGKDFRIADEIYEYGAPYDRAKVRVLLSLDPAKTNMGVKWIHRKDNDFALAWVKTQGKGRIFNTSFGHRTELFWHRDLLQFYLDGVQFAAGDIDAPTAPRADRPARKIPGTDPAPGLDAFVSLFNGKDLAGWEGDTTHWSVVDGAILGQTFAEPRLKENNFLIWKDEVEDFELRCRFKLEGGNSGIYYRSKKRPPNKTGGEALVGPQADFSADGKWTGVIMEYTLREILAPRGQKVTIDEAGKKTQAGTVGDAQKLLDAIKIGEWNEYHIVAKGGKVTLAINGVPMCELDDRDPKRPVRGWLALQVHVGPPMKVWFKDIAIKRL